MLRTKDFKHIEIGLNQLKSFIFPEAFRIDEAVLASSKAAYLASIILTGYEGDIVHWKDGDNIMKYKIKYYSEEIFFVTILLPEKIKALIPLRFESFWSTLN